ncbi:hypothetical protein [Streptomyces incanus]
MPHRLDGVPLGIIDDEVVGKIRVMCGNVFAEGPLCSSSSPVSGHRGASRVRGAHQDDDAALSDAPLLKFIVEMIAAGGGLGRDFKELNDGGIDDFGNPVFDGTHQLAHAALTCGYPSAAGPWLDSGHQLRPTLTAGRHYRSPWSVSGAP